MSRSTADPDQPRRAPNDWWLRLDADAWVLTTPAGTRRQALDDAPALQLERLEPGTAGRRARLRVVLGDGWLRYLVLRWPQGVRRREERHAYLAHRFRDVHGVGEPEWVLTVDRDTVSFPALACAAPTALIGAVQAFADTRGLRLASVAGDFLNCFNDWRRGFREPSGCFGALAVARNGRVTVGLWRDGAWQALRSQPLGEDGSAEVRRMLEAWCVGARDGGTTAPAPGGMLYAYGLAPAAPAGWRTQRCGEHGEEAWA